MLQLLFCASLHLYPRLLLDLLVSCLRTVLRPFPQRNRQRCQLGHRFRIPLFQLTPLLPADSCHQRQMIIRPPPRVALLEPPAPGTFPCWPSRPRPSAVASAHAGSTPHTRIRDIFLPQTPRQAALPTRTPAPSPEFVSANPSTATAVGSSSPSSLAPASYPPLGMTISIGRYASPPAAAHPAAQTIPRRSALLARSLARRAPSALASPP